MQAVERVPASLSNLFNPPDTEKCVRCNQRVYYAEKVGPVNGVLFHRQCFTCSQCGQHLTMKTYFTNQADLGDKELYCMKHVPRSATAGLDANAIGIRSALDVPKLGLATDMLSKDKPIITRDAMGIQQAMYAQSQFQKRNKNQYEKHHFPAYVINRQKEKLLQAQQELESIQRQEEDRIFAEIERQRELENERVQHEFDKEWESRLQELTEQFDRDSKRGRKNDRSATVKYEQEKEDLKRNMTVKFQKKKEAATMRVQKMAQERTAEIVGQHSEQMLDLLKSKQEEIKKEMEQEFRELKEQGVTGDDSMDSAVELEAALAALHIPTSQNVPPHPPSQRKRDLYIDPSVFNELDEEVFKVAESEQATFTDLVRDLIAHCLTDLQKARAVFRWITVKDLNVLEFDESPDQDTPMGILRGIKFGTETYHTLFRRLCSYAGLSCVEIKGHSKSVGYEPGMKIREDTFQNTWNAVLIDGDWWPVQCNWGARHLVLNKDSSDKSASKTKKQEKIRYQYDEHYFLTDPDEFIQEFWAAEPDWQLLERPVTLDEFEGMPFVRSVFFHYGLEFDHTLKAVLHTDNKGGTEVKIRVPDEFTKDLVFHYQLRFADRERRNEVEFRGAKLERFVFHSLVDGYALFSVHVPAPSSYFLEIFANKINDSNKIGDDPNATMMPFRLKCACKYKVVCEELVGKMHPLPNCASGEWGPSKGVRHFGLKPLTHTTGVVNVDNETQVHFRMPRRLHFLCKLRMNGVEDNILEKYVSHNVDDDILQVRVRPPQPGQYGLDIYARPEDAADNHTLAHACKYLLNCTRVDDPVDIPVSKVDSSSKMSKEKWGPSQYFDRLGLKMLSHRDPTIEKNDTGALTIEVGLSEPLKLNFHMLREPNEDYRDKVSMKENGKKAKFVITLTKSGNYLFALYARKKKETDSDMLNVYNYMIRFYPEDKDTLKKKKSLFKK